MAILPAERAEHARNQLLEEQVKNLIEWKKKAIVQLEYFRTACTLYNFCEAGELNKLLNN
jgi:hypothetical protein